MIIKLLPGNTCNSAFVYFSRVDFLQTGMNPGEISLQSGKTLALLEQIFALLREFAGLSRDGHIVCVICRPLKNGGCRFLIQFTDIPGGRSFTFREADDLLDALNQLRGELDVSEVRIDNPGGKFQIYIPAGFKISESSLAVLSEYSE